MIHPLHLYSKSTTSVAHPFRLWHLPELLAVGLVRLCPRAPLPQQLQGLVAAEATATHQKGGGHGDAAVQPQTAVHQNTALLIWE